MIEPLLAMLETLDAPALAELERVLRLQLAPARPTATQTRGARLSFLAELIATDSEPGRPFVARKLYDERRPTRAPSSALLVEQFGSWLHVCRAAHGVLPDGRINRPGSRSPRTPARRVKVWTYSDKEIADAIRACARARRRTPTWQAYESWRAAQVRAARGGGARDPRLPAGCTITRRFGTWAAAITAAAIRPGDLGAPAVAVPDVLSLPLPDAIALAAHRGCSLEALTGAAVGGIPPPAGARFNAEAWQDRIRAAGVRQRDALRALRLQLGPYRRIMSGAEAPTLQLLADMAALVTAPIATLLATPADA